MAIEGLGRLYVPVPIVAGTLLSLKDSPGIEFTVTGNDTFTLASAATYNGTTTNLAAIFDYYTNTSTSGGAKFVFNQQAPAATLTITSGMAVFFVDAAALPANALYVSVSAAASGLVSANVVYPLVQRAPQNLRPLSGSSS